jgi:hypothetical protein
MKEEQLKEQNTFYQKMIRIKLECLYELSNYIGLTFEEIQQKEALRRIINEVCSRYGSADGDWGAYEVHLVAQELNDDHYNQAGLRRVFGCINYFSALNLSNGHREMLDLLREWKEEPNQKFLR